MRNVLHRTAIALILAAGSTLLLAVELPVAPIAQTVRQGDPEDKPIPTAFHSPMVIEVPFIAADRRMWGKGVRDSPAYIQLGEYTCDNVSIRGRSRNGGTSWDSGITVKANSRPPDQLEFEIRISLVNPRHNHDKAVMLFFDILNGKDSVATGELGPVGAHDDGFATWSKLTWTVAAAAMQSDPPTTLKITMTTKDW